MLAKVTGRWLADLDSVILRLAALHVLFVEGATLGVGSVADLSEDALRLGLRLWPVNDLARSWSWRLGLSLWLLCDLDRVGTLDWRGGCARSDVVVAVHGDECSSRPVAEAAFNGLQEAADLDVTSRNLNTDELVVLLDGGVGVAVRLVVDDAGDVLGKAVSDVTELLVVAMDLIGVVAVGTLAGVCLEVVCSPGLGGIDWARDTLNGVLVEANHSRHLG